MPTVRQPRSGSMQFWPRKRAKRHYARIRTFPNINEKGLVAFAGYKVGMTHIIGIETNKNSHYKGEEISIPVTIIECPPLRIASIRFYKKENNCLNVKKEIFIGTSKALSRKLKLAKNKKDFEKEIQSINLKDYDDIRVVVHTQPEKTSLGKKKPELFEVGLGGTLEDKFNFVKENKDKELMVNSFFKEGESVDLKAITKGKGFQGPVKRFGISLRQVKSEKSIRNPGSLGPWCAQGHIMYRVAHAGKMGFHMRTEYNKQIMKIIDEPKEITPVGGFLNYGKVNSQVILVRGSVAGARKRLIIFEKPVRKFRKKELPTILEIDISSKQGN
ncbi:MAG: 50S ribosomal protein L3 [Candidatus Woesearchaeota archaeon]